MLLEQIDSLRAELENQPIVLEGTVIEEPIDGVEPESTAVRGVDRGHRDDQPPRPPAVKSAPHDPLTSARSRAATGALRAPARAVDTVQKTVLGSTFCASGMCRRSCRGDPMAATTDATRTDRGVAHPLDPLTTDEIARTVAILREGRGLGDEARFVDISLREPEKDELARHEAGEPIPARGRGRRGRPHRADDARGGGVAGRWRHRHLGHRARRAGRDHPRRVRRVRAGGPRRPSLPRGARPARHLRARER